MKKEANIKVLIVDDSFLMRRFLKEILDSDFEIEVVGEARNGEEAYKKAQKLKPDVITMDYQMPDMTGAEVTKKIMTMKSPVPIVIMISAYTKEGAEATLESLRAGAVDFVQKPSGEISLNIDSIKEEVVDRVKIAAKAKLKKLNKDQGESKKRIKGKIKKDIEAVVIGASTGGPPVVEEILKGLSEELKVSIFIAQHMSRNFTRRFAERLNGESQLDTKEASDGEKVEIGKAYVSPGNSNTLIKRKVFQDNAVFVQINDASVEDTSTPSIDMLMESVAKTYQGKVMGIILSGMGEDGQKGMAMIKEKGGYCIAQDPSEAVIDSMPESVIEEGTTDEVLLTSEIIARIKEFEE